MLRALALTLVPSLATAQEPGPLNLFITDLDKVEGTRALTGAYAACLLGAGNAEATVALFTTAGWARSDDTEMGVTELTLPGSDTFYVALYDNGAVCSVTSTATDTATARLELNGLLLVARAEATPVTGVPCPTKQINTGTTIAVTQASQDPVCDDPTNSDTRFTFSN